MARASSKRRNTSKHVSKSGYNGQRNQSNSPLYNDMLGIAGSLLRSRQEVGAEKIGTLAVAARNFAEELPDIPHIQTYVNAAADQMDALSDYVTETELENMVSDARDMAMRYPLATAAFTVAAGFAFTRLMAGSFSGRTTDRSSRYAANKKKTVKAAAKRNTKGKQTKANGRDSAHTASPVM